MTGGEQWSMQQAINTALHDAMADNAAVLALGEEVADAEGGGIFGATKGLSTRFGNERVKSTPISEQAIVGAAIGASLVGYRPVAEIMLMNFTTVAMDMITNHAAKLRFMSGGQTNVPITIRTTTGAGFSAGGQHSDYLEAWFAHTPGIKVVAPASPADAYGLLRACIDDDDPCLFIENMTLYGHLGPKALTGARVPIGCAKILRQGGDISIVAHSRMVLESLAAADALARAGIAAEIIDLRSILPWDRAAVLASARKTRRLLIVHEAVREFGIGAEIAAEVNEALFGALAAPVKRLGGAFCPVPFSKTLENAFAPASADIVATARTMMR
jgi:pyruvate dehydrogenase E1 component beta subunit